MVGVISLLVTLTLSMIVTRVAAMALMFTGLSREAAKFQARSAFTGSGFTTQESEMVVSHPVRRQIVMLLMLLGNVGIATVAATVMVSVMSTSNSTWQTQVLLFTILIGGITFLWVFFSSRWVERHMNRVIAWLLKTFTDLDVRDYVSLLELSRGYAVTEMLVEPRDWMAGKSLASLRLSDEGILVLSIRREGGIFQGTPRGDDVVHPGDVLILYGDLDDVERLDKRRAGFRGDQEHAMSVEQQEEFEAEQRELLHALEAKQALESEISEKAEKLDA
ncbi:TrkA-C domain protein [Stieleria neptunia]|uniref:TrkA-C domain protein n=1 Tax=Stieleria neptunia TaxID=2527979 RepID=A0A518HI52_9BACT|nr:TrkA C-terminal domain-containing protein [Stieleria neptunia]QDV40535.1 TrkA-C domain protein [Stieleria neptunia]